jgi:cytochrome c peroxidase
MRFLFVILGILVVAAALWLLVPAQKDKVDANKIIERFRENTAAYKDAVTGLKKKISQMDTSAASVLEARHALIACRLRYKHIAFFVEYFFPDQALVVNGPPVPEVENGMNEYRDPSGMQVIESFLFENNPSQFRNEMLVQAALLERSVDNILPFMNDFKMSADELWRGLSLELIRVYTLYITGYDAPQLKSGIIEAAASLAAMDTAVLNLAVSGELRVNLAEAKKYLLAHPDFDSFDRLYFITTFAFPLQKEINGHIVEQRENLSTQTAVNFSQPNLFAANALDKTRFPPGEMQGDTLLVALGKRLFSEPMLSGNNDRSCATCHSPAMFFSDRLRRNKNRENTRDLPRNTPSLLYAAFQYSQFWDGRVMTLPEQAITVMNDTLEMKGPGETVVEKISRDTAYQTLFKKIWKNEPFITEQHVAMALAAYVRTLTPFHSSFDRYVAGDKSALSQSEQRGFNIFMGKALCGTCHFAPLFNGLLPPLYNTTEFEVLGTPATDDLLHPRPDQDTGQARLMPFLPHGAFKTPTVRNAAMTAPFMHNGAFRSLETVIDFYDKGGGQGLGLDIPGQTLPAQPLRLDTTEKADLRAFLEALTDK